jgi:hypothetical protein
VPIQAHVKFEKAQNSTTRNDQIAAAPQAVPTQQEHAPAKKASTLSSFRSFFKSTITANKKSILQTTRTVRPVKKRAIKKKEEKPEAENEGSVDFDEQFSNDEGYLS